MQPLNRVISLTYKNTVGLRIIDLASGDNFTGIEGVEKYPSIPAKMFPESAGRVWGRTIERYIVNKLKGG